MTFSIGINFKLAKSATKLIANVKFPGIPNIPKGKCTRYWIVPSIFHISCKETANTTYKITLFGENDSSELKMLPY